MSCTLFSLLNPPISCPPPDFQGKNWSIGIYYIRYRSYFLTNTVFARNSIYAIARICDRNSGRLDERLDVWTDVRHTGGLYKNG